MLDRLSRTMANDGSQQRCFRLTHTGYLAHPLSDVSRDRSQYKGTQAGISIVRLLIHLSPAMSESGDQP